MYISSTPFPLLVSFYLSWPIIQPNRNLTLKCTSKSLNNTTPINILQITWPHPPNCFTKETLASEPDESDSLCIYDSLFEKCQREIPLRRNAGDRVNAEALMLLLTVVVCVPTLGFSAQHLTLERAQWRDSGCLESRCGISPID